MDLLKKFKRAVKWIAAGFAALLTLLFLLFLLVQTGPAKRKISSWLAEYLSTRTGLSIELSGLGGTIPFDIRLDRFTAADDQGEFAEVVDFRFHLAISSRLLFHFDIEELSASSVLVERVPSRDEAEAGKATSGKLPEKSSGGVDLPPLNIKQFRVDELTVGESLLGERVSLSVAGNFSGTLPLPGKVAEVNVTRLNEPGPRASIAVWFEETGAGISTAKIDLNLENIDGRIGGGIDCESSIEVDLEQYIDNRTLSATAGGWVSSLPELHPVLGALAGSRIQFGGRVLYLENGELRLPELSISTGAAELLLQAAVNFPQDSLLGQWQVRVPQIGVLSKALGRDLQGALEVTGEAGGSLSNFETTIFFRIEDLLLEDTRLDMLSGNITSAGLPASPSGEFVVRAAVGDLEAGSEFLYETGHLVLSGLYFEGVGAALSGELDVGFEPFLIEGNVRGGVDDLSQIGTLLSEELEGSVIFEAELLNRDGEHAFSLELHGAGLRSPGRIGSLDVSSFVFAAAGDIGKVSFNTELTGKAGTGDELELELGGSLEGTPEEGVVSVDHLGAKSGVHLLSLVGPTSFRYSERGYSLDELELEVDDARVDLSGRLEPDSVFLSAEIKGFPLELVQYAGLPDLSARLDGTLAVSGHPGRPRIESNVHLGDFLTGDDLADSASAMTVTVTAELIERTLRADLSLTDSEVEKIKGSIELPLDLTLFPFQWHLPKDGNIEGKVEIDERIERIASLIPLGGQKITGAIGGEMYVAGTVSSPEISASVRINQGTYENALSGTLLKDLNAEIGTDGRRVEIVSFEATDGDQGILSGKGWIDVFGTGEFPFELDLSAERARLLSTDEATAVTSGKLRADGTLETARLSGDLTIHSADVFLPGEITTALEELEVIEIDSTGVPIPDLEDMSKSPGSELTLDLDITLPGAVFVRGRGLDSEWRGSLDVTGRADEVRLAGFLSVVRGRFDFFGKRLRIEEGNINFTGASPPTPDVNITARTTVDDLDIDLLIGGSSSDLTIKLTSVPELPEDEVLARLLFGREITHISTMQALRLAQAARTLSGGGGTGDFLGRTRKFLSLDELDVRQSAEGGGETNVGAGKYVSDEVYVKVEKSLGSEDGRVMVEVEVTPSLSVESDVGLDSRTGVGVNWKHDY